MPSKTIPVLEASYILDRERAETLIVEEVCKMGRVPPPLTEEQEQGTILIEVEDFFFFKWCQDPLAPPPSLQIRHCLICM